MCIRDRHAPAFALPVYTRLSDAEENERLRLAKNDPKNLIAGVQDVSTRNGAGTAGSTRAAGASASTSPACGRTTMHDASILAAPADAEGVTYRPLDAAHVAEVAALEACVMGSDAWNEALVADELTRLDRVWWMAVGVPAACLPTELAGAAGSDLSLIHISTRRRARPCWDGAWASRSRRKACRPCGRWRRLPW